MPRNTLIRHCHFLSVVNRHHGDAGDCVGLHDAEADFLGGDGWFESFEPLTSDRLSCGHGFPSATRRYVDSVLENVLALGDFFFENNVPNLFPAAEVGLQNSRLAPTAVAVGLGDGTAETPANLVPNSATAFAWTSSISPRLSGTSAWRKLAPRPTDM